MSTLSYLQSFDRAELVGLAFILGLIYVVAHLVAAIYDVYHGPLSKYPGPKLRAFSSIPAAWTLYSGNDNKVLPKLHAKYGPVVRISPRNLSYNGGVQPFKDIYGFKRSGQPSLEKDPGFYFSPAGDPESVFNAGHANHSRLRKLLSHAFADKSLKELEPMLKEWTTKMSNKLAEKSTGGQTLDMVKYFNCTTFDIMADLTFHEGLNMLEDSEYSPWVKVIFQQVRFRAQLRALVGLSKSFKWLASFALSSPALAQKRMEHKKYCDDRVDRRLAREPTSPDLWSKILENSKGELSLREQYVTASLFMVAGTETTATALSGTTFHLLTNPTYLQKLVAEIRSAFTTSEDLTLDALARLKYLDAVLHEGLRMYPPVPSLLPRHVPAGGAVICGEYVPENIVVGCHQLATYRNASLFKDPDAFRPERWLGDPMYKDDSLAAVEPFSTGPRNCLGKNLAWHEMRLLLAAVILRFDLTLDDSARAWDKQDTYFLWEKHPLWCTLTARS